MSSSSQFSEANLAALINTTNDRVWSLDASYKLLVFNRAFRESVAAETGVEIVKGDCALLDTWEPDVREVWQAYYDKALAGDRFQTVYYEDSTDGIRYWETSFNPIRTEDGKVEGVAAISREITDRVHAEREMIRTRERAIEAARTKARFLSNMSHEIRTPLNAVLGTVHLLKESQPREDQVESLDVLEFSAQHLLVLVDDILEYSALEAGKIRFETRDVHLQNWCRSVEQTFALEAREKGLDLSFHLDQHLPVEVIGDPNRLTQILNNLISNALKFTREGSVAIHVTAKPKQDQSVQLIFRIEDTGIGIPAEDLERIFDRFHQVVSDDHPFSGQGLGLTIARKLVELQGGRLTVESEEGRGSVFTFNIIMGVKVLQEKPPTRSAETSEAVPQPGRKILVVDDVKVNRMIVSKILKKNQFEVDEAVNGKDAVDKIERGGFHLVLMDLQMPVMDGFAATAAIRKKPGALKELPIIALTADVMEETRERAFQSGIDDYLTKPFKPKILLEKIEAYLSK